MDHGASTDWGEDKSAASKANMGVYLFFAYALVYAGFVAIAIYDVTIMDRKMIFGLNLAITYGFGLIILALIMAVIYNHICTQKEIQAAAPATPASNSTTTNPATPANAGDDSTTTTTAEEK